MQTNAMLRKSALVVLLLTLGLTEIVAQSGALAIYGDLNANVTSQTDDYVIQNERQYNAIIQAANDELEAYKLSYTKQLETISTQRELLEINIADTEQRLIALEMLNELNKYCVQKYKVRLLIVTSVRNSILSCTQSAQSSYTSIVSSPTATIANMNSYMKSNFKSGLDNCVKLHGADRNSANYTLCVTKVIAAADSNFVSYRNNFNTQMQASTCSGDGRVKQAVDCSFKTVYNSNYRTGEVMNSINNCIEGKEFCPPCATMPPPTPPTVSDKCPNVINVEITPQIYANATISNPFRDWNLDLTSPNSTKCVELRFFTNSFNGTNRIV